MRARDQTGDPRSWPRARKRYGQHFLTDPGILRKIVDAVDAAPGDTIVEVGPGRGSLTAELLARGVRVVAVEIDRDLAERLSRDHGGDGRLSVIQADVLDVDLSRAAGGGEYAVAGNLPYYITTPILFHVLEASRPPKRSVFMVQREVGERLIAPPGAEEYGALSVNVQARANARIAFAVPAGAFHPRPRVESVVVTIVPRPDPILEAGDLAPYSAFVIACFGLRRKQIRRVLRTVYDLSAEQSDAAAAQAGIDPTSRPEILSPEQFALLWRACGSRTATAS